MGRATIQCLGLVVLWVACSSGFPLMEDLPVGGNSLDARFPSVNVLYSDDLLENKYTLPVVSLRLSPPTQEYQSPLVQRLIPPVHNFQHLPVTELRPPTLEYQPPVVEYQPPVVKFNHKDEFNLKKRIELFPDPSSLMKVPTGSKGLTHKVVTPKTAIMGTVASSSSPWWASVPVIHRRLQPPTESFYFSG